MEKGGDLGSSLADCRTRRDSWIIDFMEENWVRLVILTVKQLS